MSIVLVDYVDLQLFGIEDATQSISDKGATRTTTENDDAFGHGTIQRLTAAVQ